jgi:hypothetical protein
MVVGVVLLVVGVSALASQIAPQIDRYLPLAIGLVLLAIFAATRAYVALIFGGILTGLGTGLVLDEMLAVTGEVEGGMVVLGLGLGFVSIWIISTIGALKEHHWWPLIPGSILSLVGLGLLVNAFEEPLVGPIVMVGVGLVLIAIAYVRTRTVHPAG